MLFRSDEENCGDEELFKICVDKDIKREMTFPFAKSVSINRVKHSSTHTSKTARHLTTKRFLPIDDSFEDHMHNNPYEASQTLMGGDTFTRQENLHIEPKPSSGNGILNPPIIIEPSSEACDSIYNNQQSSHPNNSNELLPCNDGNSYLNKTPTNFKIEPFHFRIEKNKTAFKLKYDVEETIGKGSFGEVKRIKEKNTGSYKALKTISKSHCQTTDNYADEIQIIKKLV